MNLSKCAEYFTPSSDRVHIVGCGSVGSTIAENLARCGVKNITLWDFDYVESHNISNQMFRECDIGQLKCEALKDILCDINPECKDTVKVEQKGWQGKVLSGYVFLCPDSIEVRRNFCESAMSNVNIKAVFDIRTMLEGAQHYAADWRDQKSKQDLLNTMQFSHEEAAESTPVSACGVTLGVSPTVRAICSVAVANFINFQRNKGLKKFVMFNVFDMTLDAF